MRAREARFFLFWSELAILCGFILLTLLLLIALTPVHAHDKLTIEEACELVDSLDLSIPADLVVAIIWEESGGQVDVVSSAGAVGLMQIIQKFHPDKDLKDPETNIRVGTLVLESDYYYLNHIRLGLQPGDALDWGMVDHRENVVRALRGYVMGPGNVVWYDQNPGRRYPAEVTRYSSNIMQFYQQQYCSLAA